MNRCGLSSEADSRETPYFIGKNETTHNLTGVQVLDPGSLLTDGRELRSIGKIKHIPAMRGNTSPSKKLSFE